MKKQHPLNVGAEDRTSAALPATPSVNPGVRRRRVLVGALMAAYALRDVLDQKETVCSSQLSGAIAQLVLECEELIDDRDCRIPLVLVRQRIGAFVGEERVANGVARFFAQSPAGQALLRSAHAALSRLVAKLWSLLYIERRASSDTLQAATLRRTRFLSAFKDMLPMSSTWRLRLTSLLAR